MQRFLLAAGVCLCLAEPAAAEWAMTSAPVAMRAAPTGKAGVVQHIPKSAEVDALERVGGWRHVSWRGKTGFVPAGAIVLGLPPAALPGDELPPPVVLARPAPASPAWRWDGPYVGANGGSVSSHW